MGIRDRLPKISKQKEKVVADPIWVQEGSRTTKELYVSTLKEYQRIKDLIESGKAKSNREKRLVLATIAKNAGKSRSVVNVRRQAELCDWIKRHNIELQALAELHLPRKKKLKEESKTELKRQIKHLREVIEESEVKKMRDNVEAFFNSNLLDDRDKLAREISRLRLENEELIDKVTRLQHQNKNLNKEFSALYRSSNFSQRAQLKGVKMVTDND